VIEIQLELHSGETIDRLDGLQVRAGPNVGDFIHHPSGDGRVYNVTELHHSFRPRPTLLVIAKQQPQKYTGTPLAEWIGGNPDQTTMSAPRSAEANVRKRLMPDTASIRQHSGFLRQTRAFWRSADGRWHRSGQLAATKAQTAATRHHAARRTVAPVCRPPRASRAKSNRRSPIPELRWLQVRFVVQSKA
jgi:hypothetical protein